MAPPEPNPIVPAAAAPMVSVIMPFHGVEDYIGECVESVLAQRWRDFELIAVDDASPDSSRAIAEVHAAADPRVRIVIHDRNQGLGAARNTGVAAARGRYIVFLDSDDRLTDSSALSALLERAQQGFPVVVGSCQRLRVDGTLVAHDRDMDRTHGGRPGPVAAGASPFLASLGAPGEPYVPLRAWGIMIERGLYLSMEMTFPPGEHEDMAVIPFFYYLAPTVYYEERIVVDYRERTGTLSNTLWSAAKLSRYGRLWAEMRRRMRRWSMNDLIGDTAAAFACHLIYKVGQSGVAPDAEAVASDVLCEMMSDVGGARNRTQIMTLLEKLPLAPWCGARDPDCYQAMTLAVPHELLVSYHRHRLGL